MRVVITGATGGLGRSLVAAFRARGDDVTALGRSESALRELKEKTGSSTAHIDFSVAEEVNRLLADVGVGLSDADVLIHAAATDQGVGPAWELSLNEWEDNLRVNFLSAVALVNVIAPHMIRRGRGLIITVASIASLVAMPWLGPYCASKAALRHYTACLAKELLPYNVRANSMGVVASTELYHSHREQKAANGYYKAGAAPAYDLPHVDENVAPFLFLASPAGEHVSGQHIECHSAYMRW